MFRFKIWNFNSLFTWDYVADNLNFCPAAMVCRRLVWLIYHLSSALSTKTVYLVACTVIGLSMHTHSVCLILKQKARLLALFTSLITNERLPLTDLVPQNMVPVITNKYAQIINIGVIWTFPLVIKGLWFARNSIIFPY